MPKFAPNTGFKMPGIGSKNIDSPGNFRDEQHVDKVGYCDNTEERMLPEGSSPLKARYTTSGYLKDIEVLDFPTAPGKKEVKPPADKPPETKKIEKKTIAPEKGKKVDFNADQDFGKIDSPKIGMNETGTKKIGVSDKVTGTPKSTTGKGKYTDAMAYKNLGEAGVKKYGSLANFSKEAQSGLGGRDSSGTGVNVATKGGFRDAAASTSGTAGAKTGQKVSDAAKKAADKIKGIFGV